MNLQYFTGEEFQRNAEALLWQKVVFQEFESTLTSRTRKFPCVFGVAGYLSQQLRFGFSSKMVPEDIAPLLHHFIKNSRDYGKNTSLVVFSQPGPVENMDAYRNRFWILLKQLSEIDSEPWPRKSQLSSTIRLGSSALLVSPSLLSAIRRHTLCASPVGPVP